MKTDTSNNIISYLAKHEQARPKELSEHLGIGAVALHRQLKKLMGNRAIIRIGNSPRVYYSLAREQNHGITLEHIKSTAAPILKAAGVTRSAVFGSQARLTATPHSDVDILVELPARKTLLDFIELKFQLEAALGQRVDLVTYRGLKPRLQQRILHDQVGIF